MKKKKRYLLIALIFLLVTIIDIIIPDPILFVDEIIFIILTTIWFVKLAKLNKEVEE